VESECKYIIYAKVKQSSMHLSVNSAISIIALHCSMLSGRFDNFIAGRKKSA